jgi:hypothetical protein
MYINSYADKRYLLSYGICSGYGLAAAAEQESVRKFIKRRHRRTYTNLCILKIEICGLNERSRTNAPQWATFR